MSALLTTEAQAGDFSLPLLQVDYSTATVSLRKRWLPVGNDTYDLTNFDTGITDGSGPFRNPGGSTDVIFTEFAFLALRIRAYDDALPAAGSVTIELTDLFVATFTTPQLTAGGLFVLAHAEDDPYAVLSTTAIQLVSTGASNLAADLIIAGA